MNRFLTLPLGKLTQNRILKGKKSVPSDIKQNIASEINLSETAFIKIINEEDTFENTKRFALQWYTPTCEVGLCGHATVASAAVLFSICNNHFETLEFETACGILTAKKLSNGKIQINLPGYESKSLVMEEYEDIIKVRLNALFNTSKCFLFTFLSILPPFFYICSISLIYFVMTIFLLI
ncbi:phenazine biosynthesis-like domain-containing protein 1 isoform X2 [Stegodyphus dumicola]|uniref:phenazine biosynthesis-like domain-containing protein 1 isoform X2 n=1 Tax=Stegodyphus dumicola TaxID=202533 RepID=UPI0015AFEB9C|nr:phenazine biosynthesis-like domain-containing protein 1 isoform X2 [Stegodyphus dumicola]